MVVAFSERMKTLQEIHVLCMSEYNKSNITDDGKSGISDIIDRLDELMKEITEC